MKIVVIAESAPPDVNGVANSVKRMTRHLVRRGHEVLVIAAGDGPTELEGARVTRVPGFRFPLYKSLQLARPGSDLRPILVDVAPDIAYLAAPAVLGAMGARAVHELRIPSVAVFQTDLAQFASAYHARIAAPMIWAHLRRVHALADVTLAPSNPTAWELHHHGIPRVRVWGRGVDSELFDPQRRSSSMRRMLAPNDELVVGYMGRLAAEKHVERLAVLGDMPGVRTVIIGDGPSRHRLESQLPHARFLGVQHGVSLATIMASLDVFVHTGEHETFGQTIQEAHASGVPVIAPAAGGPLDLVAHGSDGFLFPVNQPEFIRSAVASLQSDPARRTAMGAAGRNRVVGKTWEVIGDELITHLEYVLTTRAAAQQHPAGWGIAASTYRRQPVPVALERAIEPERSA